MLEINDLRSGYGRIPIVVGLNLQVTKGEILGIVGHNGMGKTTLLRTIMGFLPIMHGNIRLDGVSVSTMPVHLRAQTGIGYVPQGRQIFSNLSVMDNLRFAAHRQPEHRVAEVLEQLPRLEPILDRRGGALSGGEQQILALARALCASPRLLLLDEPTEGIQPSIVDQIGELLIQLNSKTGLTIVVAEQNLHFVSDIATRTAILQKGRIVQTLDPRQLTHDNAMDVLQGMIDE